MVFLLALVATTAAVLAPVYARAAQQSVLTDGLRSASADATTLVVAAKGTAQESQSAFLDTDEIRQSVGQVLATQPAVGDRLERPVAAVDTDTTVTPAPGQPGGAEAPVLVGVQLIAVVRAEIRAVAVRLVLGETCRGDRVALAGRQDHERTRGGEGRRRKSEGADRRQTREARPQSRHST